MAKRPVPPQLTPFPKGGPGGPGRPPKQESKSAYTEKYERMTLAQLEAIHNDPLKISQCTVREVLVIKMLLRALDGGRDLDTAWDRTEGKVKDSLDINQKTISDDESPLRGLKPNEVRELVALERVRQERLNKKETENG